MKLYTANETYFDVIDSPQKAYFLGFIIGDGHVNYYPEQYKYSLSINVNEKDKEILEILKAELKYTGNLYNIEPRTFTIKNRKIYSGRQYKIAIYSKYLATTLYNYGILPNKTYTLKFDLFKIIPKEFHFDFLCGFFDADGSITINNKTKQMRFHLAGLNTFIYQIRELLNKQLINSTIYHPKQAHNKFLALEVSNIQDVIKIKKLLYQNKKFFLKRKKQIFDKSEELIQVKKHLYWTQEQEQWLIDNYQHYTLDELSYKLNISKNGIIHKLNRLGYTKRRYNKLADEKLLNKIWKRYLETGYSAYKLSKEFNVPASSLFDKLKQLKANYNNSYLEVK